MKYLLLFFLSCSCFGQAIQFLKPSSANYPDTNLVLWLRPSTSSGVGDGNPITTWSDSSTWANDATQGTAGAKPTYTANVVSTGHQGVFFTGDDWLVLADMPSMNITGDITMMTWIYVSSWSQVAIVFEGFQNGGGFVGYGLGLNIAPGGDHWAVYSDPNWRASTIVPTTGAWHHLAASCTAGAVKFYLDGAFDDTRAWSACSSFAGQRSIGANIDGTFPMTGYLRDFQIWSRALTQAEIERAWAANRD